jgi:hypothetical protein
MENKNMKPIIDPLLTLLRSRKFMVALLTLVVDVLVAYLPSLEPVQNELMTVFTLLGSVLIAAIAYEDTQQAQNQ